MHFSTRHLRLGLRTIKTALAVALALTAADALQSAMPIFAAIGAIVAMSRTLGDALTACLTQLAGTICGCLIGLLLVLILPAPPPLIIGLGILLCIAVCNRLHIQFAVPLSCIVFVSICLYDAGNPLWYALNRFTDTAIGLIIALAVNMLIKPYNNRRQISNMLTHISQAFPEYLDERILHNHYPQLDRLEHSFTRLDEEITLFERQAFPHKKQRADDAIYLRGCQQLATRMLEELTAVCSMDEPGRPDRHSIERLAVLGLRIPDDIETSDDAPTTQDIVLNYHLQNLLDAYGYLQDLNLLT